MMKVSMDSYGIGLNSGYDVSIQAWTVLGSYAEMMGHAKTSMGFGIDLNDVFWINVHLRVLGSRFKIK